MHLKSISIFLILKISMESLPFDQSPSLYFNVSKSARVYVWKLGRRLLSLHVQDKLIFKHLCLLNWKPHKAKSNYKCLLPIFICCFPKNWRGHQSKSGFPAPVVHILGIYYRTAPVKSWRTYILHNPCNNKKIK